MAHNFKPVQVFYHLCLVSVFFSVIFLAAAADNGRRGEPEEKTSRFWLTRIVPFRKSYWAKLRATVDRGCAYLFSSNIDFTGKDQATGDALSSGGTGEKVSEAAAKSFEKSKEMVEEAAKSAAEATGEAAKSVKERAKKSFSGGGPPPAGNNDDAEL